MQATNNTKNSISVPYIQWLSRFCHICLLYPFSFSLLTYLKTNPKHHVNSLLHILVHFFLNKRGIFSIFIMSLSPLIKLIITPWCNLLPSTVIKSPLMSQKCLFIIALFRSRQKKVHTWQFLDMTLKPLIVMSISSFFCSLFPPFSAFSMIY